MPKIRQLYLSEGTEVTAPTSVFNSAAGLKTYASTAAFVTAKGSAAANGDIFYNTTEHKINLYQNGAWAYVSGDHQSWYLEDAWDGSTSTKTYTVDGSSTGTGKVSDARQAIWAFKDVTNNYLQMDAEITATSATSVTVTFGGNIPAGDYLLKGVE